MRNGRNHRLAIKTATFCLILALGGCAELQRKPEYAESLHASPSKPLPIAQQPTRVALRVVQGQAEARLSESFLCGSGLPPYQKVSYELGTADNILRWTGFVGAGVVAGLIGTGMATGQDPVRGVVLLGAYGIPLAGLGIYETARESDVTEPTGTGAKKAQLSLCPDRLNQMEVRIRAPKAGEKPVLLTKSWKAVQLDGSGITSDGILLPILPDENGLSTFVPPVKMKGQPPGPLTHTVVHSPPAVVAASTILSAESDTTATDVVVPKKKR